MPIARGRLEDVGDDAAIVRRGQQEQPACPRRQGRQTAGIGLLEASREPEALGQLHLSPGLPRLERRGQLHEGQRIAERLLDEALAHRLCEPGCRFLKDQTAGRVIEALESELRKAGMFKRRGQAVPQGREKDDRIGLEAAGNEAERVDRRAIERVGLLDHDQDGFCAGGLGDQVQGREGDQERLWRG